MQVTPEQDAILASSGNVAVIARAGAGKTSTIELYAQQLPPSAKVTALAFNKAIATEMKRRLPIQCKPMTLNGLGHQGLKLYLGKYPKINTSKSFTLINKLASGNRSYPWKEVYEGLKHAKQVGFIGSPRAGKSLITEEEFFASLDQTAPPKQAILDAINESWKLTLKGECDFDDQLLSILLPIRFPRPDYLLVDEAQDLSTLNHKMIYSMRPKQVAIVGDPLQAIYAFRGAHEHSMSLLSDEYQCTPYPLTMSFRCAKSIVREAQALAPDLRALPDAPEGYVQEWDAWRLADIPQDSTILSRLNAPLFRLNSLLFDAGIYAEFVGHDIIKAIQKNLKDLGPKTLTQSEALTRLGAWGEQELKKRRNQSTVLDMIASMEVMLTKSESLGGAIRFLTQIANQKGRIKLMTIHKAKGLEFPSTFLLNPEDIGDEGQEPNLRYVAITRAINNLTYLSLEGLQR